MLFSYSPVCPPHHICDCISSFYAHKLINSHLLRLVIEVSYWMCRFNRLNYCTLMGEDNLEVFRFPFSLSPISLLLSLNFLRNRSEGVSVTAQQPCCCSILAVLLYFSSPSVHPVLVLSCITERTTLFQITFGLR